MFTVPCLVLYAIDISSGSVEWSLDTDKYNIVIFRGSGSEDLASCLTNSWNGQIRDIKTDLTLLKLFQDPVLDVKTIDMIPGHSLLPNDTKLGIIERVG